VMQSDEVCCSVMQCVAMWSIVIQCVAVCCSVLQCGDIYLYIHTYMYLYL